MPTIKTVSRESIAPKQRTRELGKRRLHMEKYDEYVQAILDAWNEDEVVILDDLDEPPLKVKLNLQSAFRRHGISATVRQKGATVQVWRNDTDEAMPDAEEAEAVSV